MDPEERSTASAGSVSDNCGDSASTTARNGDSGTTAALSPKASDDVQDSEDMVIAEEAEKEYNVRGIKHTIPYSEYRDRRLGTKP